MIRDILSAWLLFCSGYLFSKRTLAEMLSLKRKSAWYRINDLIIMDQPLGLLGSLAFCKNTVNWLQHFGSRCAYIQHLKHAGLQWWNISTLTVHSSYERRITKKNNIGHIFTSSICWVFQHLYCIDYIYSIFMKEQGSILFSLVLSLHNTEAVLNGSPRFSV